MTTENACTKTRSLFGPPKKIGVSYTSGAIEALKWLALVAMVIDHVNVYLLDDAFPALYAIGRVAFPVFGLVLAYNIAHAGGREAARRALPRLAIAGILAQPFSMLLREDLAINIMGTFALGLACAYFIRSDKPWQSAPLLLIAVLLGGQFEFMWFGIAFVWISCRWCQEQTEGWFVLWLIALAGVALVNWSAWTFAALPIILLATRWRFHIPRTGRFFYTFYPAHLAAIWLANVALK